ncbi:MAG: leucine-rich repeat domain-containing protein [Clostridiales bacterium]|nr:leucine-rich repeat domain-containing protein [Clostridiales bacterium]
MKGNKNRLSNKYIKIVSLALLIIVSILSMYLVTNTNNKVVNAKIINQKADTREVVNIPDQDLKNFLLTYFKKPDNERKNQYDNYYLKLSNTSYIKPSDETEIYKDEMEKILELRVVKINTKETAMYLTGLEKATNLTSLDLNNNKIENIEPIRGLTNLTDLYLDNNKIENIEPIKGLTHLTNLGLNTNKIDNIEILRGLTNLTYLGLDSNKIDNIEILKGLTYLTNLRLNSNRIENIEPLRELINLTYLGLDSNKIDNIESLKKLINLTDLYLNSNKIENIEPIRGLTNLTYLGLDSNKIENIEPLRGLINLTDLYLNSNKIENIEPLRGLTNLNKLYLYNNKIVNIDPLEDLINLYELDLEENKITNIEALTGLTSLNKLNLEYNEIEDISPLDSFKTNKFSFLKIMHNRIKDLSSVMNLIKISGDGYPGKLSFGDNIIKIEAPNTNRFNLPILKNSSGRVVDIEEREREYEVYRKNEIYSVQNPESYKVSPSGLLKKNEDRNIFIYKKS